MKKMWKSTLALMCALIFVLTSVLPVQVFATKSESGSGGSTPYVTASDTSIYVGDETYVTVPLSLSGNPGLLGLLLEVSYPEELTYQGLSQGGALPTLTMTESGEETDESSFRILWDGLDAADSTNGTLATLGFTVPTNAAGRYEIRVEVLDARDENIETVEMMTQNGFINVSEIETYRVNYDLTGAEGEISEQTKISGETLILSDVVPVYEGFVFKGWATELGGVVKYAPGDTYTEDADCTLYAVWEARTYQITYDAWDGTGAPEMQVKVHNQDVVLSDVVPTREGYNFMGWATEKIGRADYQPGDTYSANADVTLYAWWIMKNYRVRYDANGGHGISNAQYAKLHHRDYTLISDIPTREGYTFKGWSTVRDGEVEYAAGGTYTKNEPVTFYAVWEAHTYEVIYDANGGDNAPEAQTKVQDVDLVLSDVIPTWAGHTFNGWATEPDGPVVYAPGDTYAGNGDATLYAVWDVHTYEITYDFNGYEDSLDMQVKTHGFDIVLHHLIPARDGHDFKGWATEKNGAPVYQPGDTYTANEGVTLYAVWEIHTYEITYDANGGTGAPAPQVKTYGVEIALSNVIPTREGHTFLGWGFDPIGEAFYYAGDVYSDNGDITLYAIWEVHTYDVVYDANGGVSAPKKDIKVHNVILNLSHVEPLRTGYVFKGWATEAGGAVVYAAGAAYTENSGITLYAVWAIRTYEVTYYAWGGEGAPATQIKTHDVDLILSSDIPTRKGHTFKGWTRERYIGQVEYMPGDIYTKNVNLYLVALWEADTYHITYDANGGTGAPEAQVKTHGEGLLLSQVVPSREGHNFKGWATEKDGDVVYRAGAFCMNDTNLALYAVWEIYTYEITYDVCGGTGTPEKQIKTYGSDLVLSNTIPTKRGYTFKGWGTESNGTVVYAAGATYTTDESVTLYAIWELLTYEVIFDANGGEGAPEAQVKIYGQILNLSPVKPTREGYTFRGWATEPNGTVAYISSYWENKSITLYAVWKINTYAISYMVEPDVLFMSQTKTYGVDVVLSSVEPSRVGYMFKGWSRTVGGEVMYLPGDLYQVNKSLTLYAVFEAIRVAPITSLKLATTRATLYAGGQMLNLMETATVTPEDYTEEIIWTSSNEAVATVSASGVVTPLAKGTAKITAKSASGKKSVYCTITVNPMPEWIEITGDSAVAQGKYITLKAYAYYTDSDGDAVKTKDTISWVSLNEDIATVSKGKVTGKAAGTAVIVASVEGTAVTQSFEVSVVIPATKLKFESSKATVYMGYDLDLSAKLEVTPEVNTDEILWTSSKESVAIVDANGIVTPVGVGSAKITAKSVGGKKTASVTVTVAPVPEWIKITGDSAVAQNKYITLKGYAYYADADGDAVKTKDVVQWRSSDDSIATVTDKGKVTGIGAGTVTITAYIEGIGLEETFEITVVIPATKLKFESSKATVYMGYELDLSETLEVTPVVNTDEIVWTSSKESVAIVDENGVVTTVGIGTAKITAKAVGGKKTASVTVTVAPVPEWIEITGDVAVKQGKYITLKAYAYYMNGEKAVKTKDVVQWRSSDETIATVTDKGKVTGLQAGTVTITAYIESIGLEETFELEVVIPATKLQFESSKETLYLGQAVNFNTKLTTTPEGNTDKILWTSSKESVATVDENGVVTPVGVGSAKITAKAVGGKKTAYCTVTVKPMPEWIEITGDNAVALGETINLNAYSYYTDADGDAVKTADAIRWESLDPYTATVSNGTVKGVAPGETRIRAYIEGTAVESVITIKVVLPATELDLRSELLVYSGYSVDMSKHLTALPEINEESDEPLQNNDDIIWTSSNVEIATVDENGVVTTHGAGVVRITAKSVFGKKTASCTLNIVDGNPMSVVMSVSTGLDSEGYRTNVLNFYQAGEIKSLARAHDCRGDDWFFIMPGDVFYYTTNAAGEIDSLHRVLDLFNGHDRAVVTEPDDEFDYIYGYVTYIRSSYMDLSTGGSLDYYGIIPHGTNVLWDTTKSIKKGLSTKTSTSYLKAVKTYENETTYYYVLAKVKDCAICELVSYKVVEPVETEE